MVTYKDDIIRRIYLIIYVYSQGYGALHAGSLMALDNWDVGRGSPGGKYTTNLPVI